MMEWRFAFEVACSLCLQVTLVIAACFVIQQWTVEANARCRLWTACFLSVMGLTAAALLLPHRRLFEFPEFFDRETVAATILWQTRVAIALVIVWLVGVVVVIIRRSLLWWQLDRFLRECELADKGVIFSRTGIEMELSSLDNSDSASQEQANLLESVILLSSDSIVGPFCWQMHAPTIVVPAYLLEDDDETLKHVLLHEIAHLRTRHPMQHFLQGVCSTLLWFHPLIRSAAREAELTREYLCDEVVVNASGKIAAYLRTLARVAERCSGHSGLETPGVALPFGNRPSELVLRSNRLVRLAQGQLPKQRLRGYVAVVTLCLFSLLVQQIWLPTNALASKRSQWSPWPKWTAAALHEFEIHVRDYELFEDRVQMHEWVSH